MSEDLLQHQCIVWFNAKYRQHASIVHVPNARKQTAAQGARWTALGVVAGWPDLMVVQNGRCLLIELKTEVGVVSKAQKALHAVLKQQGTEVHVVRSQEEFEALVDGWVTQ